MIPISDRLFVYAATAIIVEKRLEAVEELGVLSKTLSPGTTDPTTRQLYLARQSVEEFYSNQLPLLISSSEKLSDVKDTYYPLVNWLRERIDAKLIEIGDLRRKIA